MRKIVTAFLMVAVSALMAHLCWGEPATGIVYDEKPANVPNLFYPSGWMGDHGDIKLEHQCPLRPHKGRYCQKWTYNAVVSQGAGWAGVAWQYPGNNWGDRPGQDMRGYKKVSFWLRGEKGGENVEIRIGGHNNSLNVTYGPVKLTNEWIQHSVDLSKEDLSNISTGFYWGVSKTLNPEGCIFYIDDIVYE